MSEIGCHIGNIKNQQSCNRQSTIKIPEYQVLMRLPCPAPPPRIISKNIIQCLICQTARNHFLLLTFLVVLFFPLSVRAQENECSTPDPDPELYELLRNQVSLVHQFAQNRGESQVTEIPVYYTVVRSSGGQVPYIPSGLSGADIDATLDFLNDEMDGTDLHFYRLGEVNYLDHDQFNVSGSGFEHTQYSYIKTAMNVYARPGGGYALQPGQDLLGSPAQHNATNVSASDLKFMSSTYPHETGHNFGLLHTFGRTTTPTGGTLLYQYPVQPGQVDHPEDGEVKRELAIRTYTPGKNFEDPNCYEAGDFFCDTDADCASVYKRTFPKFDPTNIANCIQGPQNCIGGCAYTGCAHTGDYRDYNEDPIPGAAANFMSYGGCGTQFSDEQKDWMAYTYQDYWSSRLEDLPININDQVEVRGTSEPMKNVVIRWRHDALDKYTNSLSQANGDFQGILYDTDVKAEVRKIGATKKQELYYPPNQSPQTYYVDDYTNSEWLEGLTTFDLVCIKKDILNIAPLNDGYQIIAADANKSNSVTTFDIVELRKLILGIYDKLPAHNAPWRFVPEYIPQNHAIQFNFNPFDMTINGQPVSGTPYTEPTWEYAITDGNNGQSGYDGIKIGDVCDTQFKCEEPPALAFNSTSILAPNEIYEISVKATDFEDVVGFQLGIFVDHEQLEVQAVDNGSLPEFAAEDNVGMTKLAEDQLNMVWFQSSTASHTIADNNTLFKITVKALQPVSDLGSAISLDTEKALLKSEFFDDNGCVEVQLSGDIATLSRNSGPSAQSADGDGVNSTLYCYPNPAGDRFTVVFENGPARQGTLRFSDVNGKLIKSIALDLTEGINRINLQAGHTDGLPEGLLNIALYTDEGVKIGRMLKL